MVQPLLHKQFFDAIRPDRPTYHPIEQTSWVDKAVGQIYESFDKTRARFIGLPDVTAGEPVDTQSRQPAVYEQEGTGASADGMTWNAE